MLSRRNFRWLALALVAIGAAIGWQFFRTANSPRSASASSATSAASDRPASNSAESFSAAKAQAGHRSTARPAPESEIAREARAAALEATGADRHDRLLDIARRWAEEDPARAAAWLRSLKDESLLAAAAGFLVPALAAQNRGVAGDLLAALPAGQTQSDLADQLVTRWSGSDFDGALEWACALPPGPLQQRALVHLSYTWEQVDPRAALAFAHDLPPGNDQLLDLLVSRIAARAPEQASAWLGELPEGERRDRAIARLLSTWAAEAPELAATSVSLLPPGEKQEQAATAVVSAWAMKSPAEAANWAAQFPPGRTREYALENVAWHWAKADLATALTWMQTLPAGRDQDAAIHAAAGALIEREPEAATKLAAAIRDQSMRERQVERAAKTWLAQDRAAAAAWLANSDLPAERKEQLQRGP